MIEKIQKEVRQFLEKNADERIVKKYSRYFKDGYDAYGVDFEKTKTKTKKWFKDWEDKLNRKEIIKLCESFLKSGKYEEGAMVINFISYLKKFHDQSMFNTIWKWLEKYITNWAHCDVTCGEILSGFILEKIVDFKELFKWTDSKGKWQRRAVPVTMVTVFKKTDNIDAVLKVAEKLIMDEERVVHQGLGWLLREAWKKNPKEIEKFLLKWKNDGPRLVYQYATEKMDKKQREKFRREK